MPRRSHPGSHRLAAALVAALLPFALVTATGAAGCQFQMGFAVVHDLIPDVVGDCTVDEHHNPQNGDGLQETTRGMLVWRKADNFTAFTDGYRTWVNGPPGLQQRLNTEQFDWEGGGRAVVLRRQAADTAERGGASSDVAFLASRAEISKVARLVPQKWTLPPPSGRGQPVEIRLYDPVRGANPSVLAFDVQGVEFYEVTNRFHRERFLVGADAVLRWLDEHGVDLTKARIVWYDRAWGVATAIAWLRGAS
jgi:hypothetical protein